MNLAFIILLFWQCLTAVCVIRLRLSFPLKEKCECGLRAKKNKKVALKGKALNVRCFCPFRAILFFMCLSWRDSLVAQLLIEESQQSSGCNGRTDDSRNVWSHGVHEKEVVAVVFQT